MPKTLSNEDTQTQCRQIESYLLSGSGITPQLSLKLFGCFRLAARIHDLKKKLPIQSAMVNNGKSRHAVYFLTREYLENA